MLFEDDVYIIIKLNTEKDRDAMYQDGSFKQTNYLAHHEAERLEDSPGPFYDVLWYDAKDQTWYMFVSFTNGGIGWWEVEDDE